MRSRTMIVAGVLAVSNLALACSTKEAADATTVAPTAATIDKTAEAAAIIRTDSGWVRHVMGGNVDSLVSYYTPDAVSYGFGSAPSTGTDALKASYTEMVKSKWTDPKVMPGAVTFSDDGTMAFDHGIYQMTMQAPGGRPEKVTGAYLNVWKKVDGQWKMAAEMSTPVPAPPNM